MLDGFAAYPLTIMQVSSIYARPLSSDETRWLGNAAGESAARLFSVVTCMILLPPFFFAVST